MALPVEITGFASNAAKGPFKSSDGNYYVVGISSASATTVRVNKSTDVTSAWNTTFDKTGFATQILTIQPIQDGDLIRMVISDGSNDASTVNIKYSEFDMSTDSFLTTTETVNASGDTRTSGGQFDDVYHGQMAIRSASDIVIAYSAANAVIMGTSYSRVAFKRRTGVNTYSAQIEIIDGIHTLEADYGFARCLIGNSDRVHAVYILISLGQNYQRTLKSDNTTGNIGGPWLTTPGAWARETFGYGLSWDQGGTQKVLFGAAGVGGQVALVDSADNLPAGTGTTKSIDAVGPNNVSFARDAETGLIYGLWQTTSVRVFVSGDGGLTWGDAIILRTGVVAGQTCNVYSRDGVGKVLGYTYIENVGGNKLFYNEMSLSPQVIVQPRGTIKQTVVRSNFW